jgi:hypothetical protein
MILPELIDFVKKKKYLKIKSSVYSEKAIEEFLILAEKAECFSFGKLPLEVGKDGNSFSPPKITDTEYQIWEEGLIPLPAPVCWYEFYIGDILSCILIKSENNKIYSQRIEFGKDFFVLDGTWSEEIDRKTFISNNDVKIANAISKFSEKELANLYGSNPTLVMYMTFMLNSKTTEIERFVPDKSQIRLRKQLGKSVLRPYTIVNIVPVRYIAETRGSGTHASPRLHWRRSHIRVLYRGTPNEKKIVIPRFLVGLRELGEVKHDYVVETKF